MYLMLKYTSVNNIYILLNLEDKQMQEFFFIYIQEENTFFSYS